jgi:hypothetical protein
VVARLLPSWLTNKPLPHPHDYVKFAEEGARRNVIIASCIWTLVTSAAEPTFRAGRKKADGTVEPLPATDPLAQLLAAPNPDASPYDFLEELLTHQQVAGQGYVHKVRDRSGIVVQLWPLRPDRVRIIPGPDGRVAAYRYTAHRPLIRDTRSLYPHGPALRVIRVAVINLGEIVVLGRHPEHRNRGQPPGGQVSGQPGGRESFVNRVGRPKKQAGLLACGHDKRAWPRQRLQARMARVLFGQGLHQRRPPFGRIVDPAG